MIYTHQTNEWKMINLMTITQVLKGFSLRGGGVKMFIPLSKGANSYLVYINPILVTYHRKGLLNGEIIKVRKGFYVIFGQNGDHQILNSRINLTGCLFRIGVSVQCKQPQKRAVVIFNLSPFWGVFILNRMFKQKH